MRPKAQTGRLAVALITLVCAAPSALAVKTTVALAGATPELAPLIGCLSRQLADSGPEVPAAQLREGIEFRISRSPNPDPPQIVTITALLKPNVSALGDPHDDPEAQPAAAARVYDLLRIHLGTRSWVRRSDHDKNICREAAAWMTDLRSKPVLFDRLGDDGERQELPEK